MPNSQQNNIYNEIEQVNKEINLLQDRLKKNEKSQNQFKNGLMHMGKKDKGRVFLKTKKYKI